MPLAAALALVLPACAGAPSAATSPPPPREPAPARTVTAKPRTDELANAKVYDEAGNAGPCAPPLASCPPLPAASHFLDQCRLAGFQVRQCGCEARCSGDAVAASRHYDEAGAPRACAPSKPDCTPPPASAAFQDACAERGYRLDVCGCEWLCSGNPKK